MPTLEEVEAADREQICRWYRFLPSPGMSAIECTVKVYEEVLERESKIMARIVERFGKLGGMTPAISKKIGWE